MNGVILVTDRYSDGAEFSLVIIISFVIHQCPIFMSRDTGKRAAERCVSYPISYRWQSVIHNVFNTTFIERLILLQRISGFSSNSIVIMGEHSNRWRIGFALEIWHYLKGLTQIRVRVVRDEICFRGIEILSDKVPGTWFCRTSSQL